MSVVRVISLHAVESLCRQSPNGDGRWGAYSFRFNDAALTQDDGAADWLVVFDEPAEGMVTRIPVARRILFVTEPPSIKRYTSAYLQQFGTVLSPFTLAPYGGRRVRQHSALSWFYGAEVSRVAADGVGVPGTMAWADLLGADTRAMPSRGLVSAICSTKIMNLNHMRRLRFLAMAKAALGDRLTIFGRGFQPLRDKAEGLSGFRYHLVLENSLADHGWTEKLADPILAGVFPIVAGAPNLAEDFDPQGFALIDTRRPRAAIEALKQLLDDDPAARAGAAMAANKQRLMNEHNFLAVCARLIDTAPVADAALLPSPQPLARNAKRSLWQRALRGPRLLRNPVRRLYLTLMEWN